MPERVDFWGIPGDWGPAVIYTTLLLSAVYMLGRLVMNGMVWWRIGRPEVRWDHPLQRLGRVVKYYLGQYKVMGQSYPGWMHLAIFSSMVIFFLGTALATLHSHFFPFLLGPVYLAYKLILDLSILVFIVGMAMAAYRRFVQRPDRLTLQPKFAWTLGLLTFIVLLGPLVESLRLAIEKPAWAAWSPIGWAIAQIWIGAGLSEAAIHTTHQILYALHVVAVIALFVTLPTGTMLHVVTSALNIFFSKLDQPTGKLAPVPATGTGEYIYADRLSNLTWKQLLDADSCTECGRCQDVCPAYVSGRPLSPKKFMISLQDALHAERPALTARGKKQARALVGEWVSDPILWSCATCGACVSECPVLIEHLDSIVDMRRYLISESRLDPKLKQVLEHIERYGNSFGQAERARIKWTQTVQPKIKDARREEVEYLWFVGDYASYNPMLVDVTRKTAEIFQKAGLDFGILYEAERNSGNDIRRVGEEGLFEFLVEKNTAAFQKANFKFVVTTDPHSYNTLKNEYPAEVLGGKPVLHYSELLDQLITSGKLKLSKQLGYPVTYHDPCYLGRYNQVYEAPRRVIQATGCQLVEMPRNRSHSFCCNAGGGQIWMQEQDSRSDGHIQERPGEIRVREALALKGVGKLIVTCPKDFTMYRDAVKTTSTEDQMKVLDLIDLVYEAL